MIPRYEAKEVRGRFAARRLRFSLPEKVKEGIAQVFGEPLSAEEAVRRIVEDVAARGQQALDEWSLKLDRHATYEVPKREWREAYDDMEPRLREALGIARERLEKFHRKEPKGGFLAATPEGMLAQIVRPIRRVGAYVPGGSAPLLSTVLHTVVLARVAGVQEIIVATPPPVHPAILAAAWAAGADRVFAMGGAQAIAAFAYGTEAVPRVDKIVGPGNLFVTLAKKEVFGAVGVDGLAGPTETLIVADALARPELLAADLLAQAEHDPSAEPWLLSPDAALLDAVARELERQLDDLPRAAIARESLANGGLVHTSDLAEALTLADLYAPEHLCLSVERPTDWLGLVHNAGGIFLGEHSGEAIGDYVAGPSHVMPTSGSARWTGALAVRDFLKIVPVVALGAEAAAELSELGARLAREEELEAHARALDARAQRAK
ncbi:histidinol dehydrogenase [Oceanithermus sp.]